MLGRGDLETEKPGFDPDCRGTGCFVPGDHDEVVGYFGWWESWFFGYIFAFLMEMGESRNA